MRVLVMGGTRMIGLEVVGVLHDRGHEVSVFNRGTRSISWPGPVSEIVGDRSDPGALNQLARLQLDAVVDLSAYTRVQTELLLDTLPDVARVVHCSTGAVYEPQAVLPWPEAIPYGPWRLWGTYAAEKLGCELALRERRPPNLATTAIRLPYVFAPNNYVSREEFVLNRLLDSEEVFLPGDGQAVTQFISARQVGQVLVGALEAFADGGWRAFNAGEPTFVSLEGFVELCAEVAGVDARVRAVGGGPTGLAEDVFDPIDCVFPLVNANYVLDVTALADAGLAPRPEPLSAMIAEAFRSLVDHPERRTWTRTDAELRVASLVR